MHVRRCDTSCSTYTEIAYLVKTKPRKGWNIAKFSLSEDGKATPSDLIKGRPSARPVGFIPMQKACWLAQTDLLTSLDFKFKTKVQFSDGKPGPGFEKVEKVGFGF